MRRLYSSGIVQDKSGTLYQAGAANEGETLCTYKQEVRHPAPALGAGKRDTPSTHLKWKARRQPAQHEGRFAGDSACLGAGG